MSDHDTQAIIDVAQSAVTIGNRVADAGGLPIAIGESGVHVMHDVIKHLEERAPAPPRFRVDVAIRSLESLEEWVRRYGSPTCSMLYASVKHKQITVIANDEPRYVQPNDDGTLPALPPVNGRMRPGWRDVRATTPLQHTRTWLAWMAICGKPQTQEELSDFLEEWSHTICVPEAGDEVCRGFGDARAVLQLARDLQIVTGNRLRRTVDQRTGAVTLIAETEAGNETTDIPRGFCVLAGIFTASDDPVRLDFLLRMRVVDNKPTFTIKSIDDLDVMIADDVTDIAQRHGDRWSTPWILGEPPAVAAL